MRMTPIVPVGIHRVQLIVGPDSDDTAIDYCSSLEERMDV